MTTDVHDLVETPRVSAGAVMFAICAAVAICAAFAALVQPFVGSAPAVKVTVIQ